METKARQRPVTSKRATSIEEVLAFNLVVIDRRHLAVVRRTAGGALRTPFYAQEYKGRNAAPDLIWYTCAARRRIPYMSGSWFYMGSEDTDKHALGHG